MAAEIRFLPWRRLTDNLWTSVGGTGTDRHYCSAKKTLRPELVFWLSVAPRHVHPTDRLFYGRCRQALPRVSTFHESVYRAFGFPLNAL